jgi:hypothetical protein
MTDEWSACWASAGRDAGLPGAPPPVQRALDAGLFRLARRESAGLPDPAMASAVGAALAAHGRQSIASELPEALRQALAGPALIARISALQRLATAERARLAAMQAAARNAEGARRMADALTQAGLGGRVEPLLASTPIAWLIDAERPG